MYRLLSVEDNPDEESLLRSHVARYNDETGAGLSLSWARSAEELDRAGSGYDLLLVDIDLPGIDGMEMAARIRATDPDIPIVFLTSLAQYALRGYEVDALDFAVKPISYQDFRTRMDRAVRVLRRREARLLALEAADGTVFVPATEVSFIEVNGHDLTYHLEDGRRHVVRGSLVGALADLDGLSFVRTAKGFVANMAHIRRVRGTELLMDTGDTLVISRSYKRATTDAIARYLGGNL